MADRAPGEALLREAWRSVGHRFAVLGGSLVALISLLQHVPASTAALRGGATWLAVLVVARLGFVAIARAAELDRREEAAREAAEESRR